MNIMLGHQQIEIIHILFTILKSKNRPDKIENIKKNHIQKCISWCEKINLSTITNTINNDKPNVFTKFNTA